MFAIRRHCSMFASMLTLGALVAGCGGSGGGDKPAATQEAPTASAAVAAPAKQADAGAADWTFCASEHGTCNFRGTRKVRYGTKGLYKYATFTNGVRCSNAVFGDPNFGRVKACSVSVAPVADAGTPAPEQPPGTASPHDRNIKLAWIAPQTNADGSPLTDLAGYRLRYGNRSGSYSNTVQIESPHTLNHVLQGLPASTYYLIVTAYNSANVESLASAEVSKTIR